MKVIKKTLTIILVAIIFTNLLSVTAFAADDILKRGSKGSKVEELQTILKQQGYFNYDKITGYFGKITEDSVKSFQKANGLKADGIVGKKTWAMLTNIIGSNDNESVSIDDAQQPGQTSLGSMSEGMEGPEIEKVQKRLQELGLYEYSRVTGYYGSITEDAVKSFQKAYGLKPDGVVGPLTMEKLFSPYKETSLIPGMKSDEVEKLQERLKELGYYSYSVDGGYGEKTREAVTYFQRANSLTADGIAGTKTKQILYSNAAIKEQDARRDSSDDQKNDDNDEKTEISDDGMTTIEQMIALAKSKIGSPYVYADEGPDTFDCSGFTTYIMKQFGVSLPRSAYNQGYDQYGVKITDKDNLLPGDLVFFNTNNSDGDLSDHVEVMKIRINGGS